jgi:diaminopimelate decarboxylase
VFPGIFRANLASFRARLDRSGLAYRIHYAHKANQARAFVRAALDAGIGIDVASPGELASALAAGFPADRIEATGPKGRPFLSQLAENQVAVNVDNLWELAELIRLARERGRRVPVLVRLCGFGVPGAAGRLSRFGVPAARYPAVLDLLRAGPDAVNFLGLSTWTPARPARRSRRPMTACGCSSRPAGLAWPRACWISAAGSGRPSPGTRRRSMSTCRP